MPFVIIYEGPKKARPCTEEEWYGFKAKRKLKKIQKKISEAFSKSGQAQPFSSGAGSL